MKLHIASPYDKNLDDMILALDSEKPVVVYDTYGPGRLMKRFLNERGIHVSCYCSPDYQFEGIVLDSVPVYSMKSMLKHAGEINLVICTNINATQAAWQFAEYGFKADIKAACNRYKFDQYGPIKANTESIIKVFEILHDKRSKEVLYGIINSKLTGNLGYIENVIDQNNFGGRRSINHYFEESIVKLNDDECFVDAGVFDGKTTEDFLTKVNGITPPPNSSNYPARIFTVRRAA